jgi:predicted adenylyl cyclase CyaB
MKSNIEIKAKIIDLGEIKKSIEQLCSPDPSVLNQRDIYYDAKNGRLKLRIFSVNEGELIYYERENIAGPKRSDYSIYKTTDPVKLNETLSSSLQVIGVVEKRRTVYVTGQTRIHLDEVNNLGNFIELEVVLKADQNSKDGISIAKKIIEILGISKKDLIKGSYIDLIK